MEHRRRRRRGYHNDQWLISPRLTGLTATSTVSYWLRFAFTNFPDTVYFRVSTNGPAPANFTFVPLTNVFARASHPNQFPPWSNHVVNVGALGIPAGTPIWIAIHEYEWDNTHNGAAIQLDVINSDLTAPPQARVGPTSLTFTAYYEGADPAPQTFALQSVGSSGLGYSSAVAFGAGPTSWLSVGGPAFGTIGFQGSQVYTASVAVAGLDLGTYVATNVFNVPGATNNPLRVPITLHVIRRPQTISFPNPGPQYTTNQVGLAGTASSGLPVTFSVFSGPGSIVGATNLSFTGTGTVRVVAWQLGNVYYDVAPCVTQAMAVTKPNAGILFSDLSHVYDGSPHGATVTTVPEGLAVVTTYNGGDALPVAIGSYAVTSTINDAIYDGTATSTFTITRMVQTVDFPDPGAQWTTSVVGLAATASSGLPVAFAVASGPGTIGGGTNLSFTGAGTVSVVASQAGDADWLPAAATNDLAVSKAEATVMLGSLGPIYDGTPKTATATTDPAGLAVEFTYDGGATAPMAAGSYAVTGTVNDVLYRGEAVGTLTIGKGAATVTLESLDPTYDGTPRPATVTTDPAGLAVDFTYDGATNEPVAVGSYAVTGTVNEANWQGSATGTLTIGKGAATVTLENLEQEYDGTPRPATATTVPAGLAVDFTYDGATNEPVVVGSYAATGTVNDANWQGSAAGTLAIGKGTATITLDGLAHVYDGTEKNATATTIPAGLAVVLTYAGETNRPVEVGSYAVTGTVNEANWQGTNGGTLVIAKSTATVTLIQLSHVYDGTAKSAVATTTPLGLAVDITYAGETNLPVEVGSYAVTGTVNEANWQGTNVGTLVIGKGTATVMLGDLSQNYDGTARIATATTDPAGLVVDLTYDGSPTPPTAVGSYVVTGVVADATYQGSAVGTLVVAKGTQAILDFLPPDGTWFELGATTSLSAQASSGLSPVTFSNLTPAVASLIGNDIAFTNRGRVQVVAHQAGNASWNAVSVIHQWSVGGLITNVVPGAANVGGGIEIVVQGINLGNGQNIATVTLAGVAATIVTQSLDEVRVFAAAAPAAATGDVAVTTASGSSIVLGSGFEYLWLDPPEQLDPAEIRVSSFLARWRTVPAAATHLLDVGTDTNFSAFLPGYSARDVGTAQTHRVTGLALGSGFATRLFAWNEAGLSWPSRTVWTDLALRSPGDFDGDGVPDPLIFQPATGTWDMESSTGTAEWLTPWGGRSMVPVPADYDGDGTDDFALYQRSTGYWYLRYSSGGSAKILFGAEDRIPLPGDYDGDGRADLATYLAAEARWAFQATTAGPYELAFGGSSLVPVPADYDGDGALDVALYKPAPGVWYVLYSGGGSRVAQMGWATTVPVPADYDGDGKADLAVLNRPTSNWCIQYSGGGSLVVPFGYKTMTPVPADYDGDGLADIAMYHEASGTWYVRDSFTGAHRSFPLGGPGQLPAHRIPLLHAWFGLPWAP